MFGLHRFKLHRHLVDGTVNSVWFRQVFGLHRFKLHKHLVDRTVKSVWFRQVFGLHRFKLHRHLGDGTVKSVWFRQDFGLLRVRFRHASLYYPLSEINLNIMLLWLSMLSVLSYFYRKFYTISFIYVPNLYICPSYIFATR